MTNSLLSQFDIVELDVIHTVVGLVVERANHELEHVIYELAPFRLATVYLPAHISGGGLSTLDHRLLPLAHAVKAALVFVTCV